MLETVLERLSNAEQMGANHHAISQGVARDRGPERRVSAATRARSTTSHRDTCSLFALTLRESGHPPFD